MDQPSKPSSDIKSASVDLEQTTTRRNGNVEDLELSNLGLRVETSRDLSLMTIIACGWNICVSWWAGVAAAMALSIASGGSVALVYGLPVILVTVGCSALSLAELASVYPTAGGQYHWTSILAPKSWNRSLSYWCGCANLFGWIATTAGVAIIPPQLIAAIIVAFDSSYVIQRWHIFLMFQALQISLLAYNILVMKRTPWVHDIGFVTSLLGFVVIVIICLVRSPTKQTSDFVWVEFQNNSGWSSDSIAFLISLVNANYIYSGLDGAIHLAEECKNAAVAVPQALLATIVIGFVTAFAFVVAMVYSMTDFDQVLTTATGVPIYELWIQATRSRDLATFFQAILITCGFFALIGCQQTASRLCWSMARDDALICSAWLGQIHPKFGVPVWALVANSSVVFIIGCIYLGSSTAFNAMIGTGLILQQLSYAFPTALLMFRRRSRAFLPANRYIKLGIFGWIANFTTVAFAIIVGVFYNFPSTMPVAASNMNYASVVLGAMAIFTLMNWFVHAKRQYKGPRLPDELMLHET